MSLDYRHRVAQRCRTRSALRLPFSVSVVTAVAAWVVGCGDPQPPVAQSIEDLTVEVGSTESVDLGAYFSDPDGDELTYTASSSNTGIATVSVSVATAQVTGVAAGSATVDVTATDPGGLLADQTFTVMVPNRAPVASEPIEDIEVFLSGMRHRWMSRATAAIQTVMRSATRPSHRTPGWRRRPCRGARSR